VPLGGLGVAHLTNLKSTLVFVMALIAFEAHAQEKINKPGFIPAGVMVCDELDCKFLSESHETAAKIVSYEPAVGVHVLLNGKSYVVPGEEVFIQNNGCRLRLHAYVTKNFTCEELPSTQDSTVQNSPGSAAVPPRALPEHGQMFADPLQRTLGGKTNSSPR
jgi:hypothetical protein